MLKFELKQRPLSSPRELPVSRLLGESWRRTYSPIIGAEKTLATSAVYHAPQRLVDELTDDNKLSLVAERSDGSIAGYAMSELNAVGDLFLDRLHIDQKEYGTGLAAEMLSAVCMAYPSAPSMALEVLEGNDRALAFYRKNGFDVLERRPAPHGADGHFSIIMRKGLPS